MTHSPLFLSSRDDCYGTFEGLDKRMRVPQSLVKVSFAEVCPVRIIAAPEGSLVRCRRGDH